MSREKPRLRRGDTLCWAHAVDLPRTARTEAGEAVDLPERRRWLGRALLPWRNSGLAFLYAEEVLDLAGSWEHRAGPEVRPRDARAAGDPLRRRPRCRGAGRPRPRSPRRRGGRPSRSCGRPGTRSGSGSSTRGRSTQPSSGRGRRGRPATARMHPPRASCSALARDHRRRTETRWYGGSWAEGGGLLRPAGASALGHAYTQLQRPPRLRRLLLTCAADDGPEQGQACRHRLTPDGTGLDVRLPVPTRPADRGLGVVWVPLVTARGGAGLAAPRRAAPGPGSAPAGRRHLGPRSPGGAGPAGASATGAGADRGLRGGGHRQLATAVVPEERPSGWVQLTRPLSLKPGGVYAKPRRIGCGTRPGGSRRGSRASWARSGGGS
jgi:hypothetical protein